MEDPTCLLFLLIVVVMLILSSASHEQAGPNIKYRVESIAGAVSCVGRAVRLEAAVRGTGGNKLRGLPRHGLNQSAITVNVGLEHIGKCNCASAGVVLLRGADVPGPAGRSAVHARLAGIRAGSPILARWWFMLFAPCKYKTRVILGFYD